MYRFYYEKLTVWDPLTELLLMDTDSYLVKMSEDPYEVIKNHLKEFDTSNYPQTHPLYSSVNKNVPGSPKPKAMEVEPLTEPPKKKRGRPTRDPNKKLKKKPQVVRLWEFLRELLRKPESCPSLIKWEDHDKGEFRFVQSDKVAKLWGAWKGISEMTYEKLIRAMRYHYQPRFLEENPKRNVYNFGPNATGWRVEDPNFVRRNSSAKKDFQTAAKPNPILSWKPGDILDWLAEEAVKLGVDYSEFCGQNYAGLTGKTLSNMSEDDFEAKSPGFGTYLYWCLFSKRFLFSGQD